MEYLPCEMRSLFLRGETPSSGVAPRKRPGQAGRWYWDLPRLSKRSVDPAIRGPVECGAYSSGVGSENRTGVENQCDFSSTELLNIFIAMR